MSIHETNNYFPGGREGYLGGAEFTPVVDRLIGNAFPTVKYVAENLQIIKYLVANMASIISLSNGLNDSAASAAAINAAAAASITAINAAISAANTSSAADIAAANASVATANSAVAAAVAALVATGLPASLSATIAGLNTTAFVTPAGLNAQTNATFARSNALTLGLALDNLGSILTKRPGGPPRFLFDTTTGFASRKEKILYCIPVWGQSLAQGASIGSPIATTPIYPGRALMPCDGNGNSCLHPTGAGIGGMIDLVEGQAANGVNMWANPTETLNSSMINHLIRDIDAILPGNNLKFATFIAALGGQSYIDLKAGSQPFFWYSSTLSQIVEWALNTIGYRVVVSHLAIRHGEADAKSNFDRYTSMMTQFQRDITTITRSITGQDEQVTLLVDQTGYTLVGQNLTGQGMMEAQRKLPDSNPYIRSIGPNYQFPRNPADHIHMTAPAENKAGMKFSRVIRDDLVGASWRGFEVVDAYFNAAKTAITVDLFVPVEPFQIDLSGDVLNNILSTYGIDFIDPNGNFVAISSVTIISASTNFVTSQRPQLLVTLASAYTMPWGRLSYANRREGVPCAVSIGSPGVITLAAHGMTAGNPFILQAGPGAVMPGNAPAQTMFYVQASGLTTNTLQFALYGGSSIITTGTTSGQIYLAADNGTGSTDGNLSGARGPIHDSANQASLYPSALTGAGLTAYDNNFLISFSRRVGG